MSSGSSSQTIGFKYFFDIHMGVSRGPVDELVEIRVGDKSAWRGSVTSNSTVTIAAPTLFGGTSGEGGVEGSLQVLMGGPTQVAPPEMVETFGVLPGFRKAFTLFFRGMVTAMNPYPKPWSVRHRRALSGWDGGVWYPEKCIVSLVRPVSAGEVASGSTETSAASGTLTEVPVVVGTALLGPWSITLADVSEPVLSVQEVAIQTGFSSESNGYDFSIIPSTTYSLTGNVLTLNLIDDGTNYVNYTDQLVRVTFQKTITTEVPAVNTLGSTLIQAMNPAHIIYECLTNREWGRGLPRSTLDDASFRRAADALHAEGFGLCLRWRRRDEVRAFIQSVLDHCGGVLYENRVSGLLTFRLIRYDYDQAQMTMYDSDNGLLEITDASVGAAGKMINEVRVMYRDPVTNEDRVVRASNLAAMQSSGGVINTLSKEYPGAPTAAIAARLAKRDLKAASPNLRRYSLVFDRRANNLTPGGVVRIQDIHRGIPDTVLRIGTVDYGSLTDGKIKVTALQDVFGTPAVGFNVIGPPTWAPPVSVACVGNAIVYELPYRTVYRNRSAADFAFIDNDSAYLGLAISKGTGSNANALTDMAVKLGGADASESPADTAAFCGFVGCLDPNWSQVILLLPMDTTFQDRSNYLRNGTSFNQAQISTTGAKFVGSGVFDGAGDRVDYQVGTEFNFGTGDFTVSMWINPNTLSSNPYLMSYRSPGAGKGWYANLGTGNISWAPSGESGVLFGPLPPLNTWSHLAFVRHNGVMRCYLNGVQSGIDRADTRDYMHDVPGTLTVGADWNGTNCLDGRLDDVRVSRVAEYTAPFTPPSQAAHVCSTLPVLPQIIGYFEQTTLPGPVFPPTHLAGDLAVLFLRSVNLNATPALLPGWTDHQSIAVSFGNGWRVMSRVLADTVTLSGIDPTIGQMMGVILRGAAIGAVSAIPAEQLGVNTDMPTLTLTNPGGSYVLAGASSNQPTTYTAPGGMTSLGNNENPNLGGGRMELFISTDGESTFAGRTAAGNQGAYSTAWAIEIKGVA